MIRYFKKYRKQLLAIFGVGLMITFVANIGTRDNSTGRDTTVHGHMGKTPIQAWEYTQYAQEWDALAKPAGGGLQGPTIIDLIFMEATGTRYPASRMLNEQTYMLLSKEAQRMNAQVGQDTLKEYMANLPVGQMRPDREDALRRGVGNTLAILQAFRQITGGIKVSQPMRVHLVADSMQEAAVQLVEVKASQFKDKIAPPTTQQIQEQFDKYRNVDPEQNEFGFGYRYPDRVKIQYIMIPGDQVRAKAASTVTPNQVYAYYREHLSQFPTTEATTQPSPPSIGVTPAAPATRPVTGPTTKPFPEVEKEITDSLVQAAMNKLMGEIAREISGAMTSEWNNYRQGGQSATGPATAQSAPYPSYEFLQKVARTVGAKHGIQLTAASEAPFLSRKELAELPGIGKAQLPLGMRGGIPFPQYAIELTEPLVSDALRKQMTQNHMEPLPKLKLSTPLVDDLDNFYFFRIVDGDAAHAPAEIGLVRSKIEEDVRTKLAYEKALERAKEIQKAADQQGMASAATSLNALPVTITGLFPKRPGGDIPNYPITGRANSQFVEGAFKLVTENVKTGRPHPVGVIEMPAAATVVVAQLDRVEPARKDAFFPLMLDQASQYIVNQQTQAFMQEWFNPDAVAKRTEYRAEEVKGRPNVPDQPQRQPAPPLGF